MTALARWCHTHRLVVILVWVAALVGLGAATMSAGSSYSSVYSQPNTDSTKADTLMAQAFPAQSGDSATLVWHVDSGTVRAQAVETRMTSALASIGHLSDVSAVANPYAASSSSSSSAQISADGKTAYATIALADGGGQLSSAQIHTLIDTAQKSSTTSLDVELGGSAIQSTEQSPASDSEIVGIIAAAVVLFLAFGSLFAMALPILTGVAGVGGGLMAVGLLTHATAIADFAPSLGALIGLGVGIDYALFIVSRFRCALRSGQQVREAVGTAVNTSGRAVLFAGGTVCIALIGMLVLGVGFLDGVALAAAITVGFTVLAALTLLPAMLAVLGPRVFSRRERRRIAAGELLQITHGTEDKRGWWRRWAGSVERRPRLMSLVALVMMAALAIPTLSLRLGAADAGNDPASTTTRKAYDLLAEGFGAGFNGPLVLVAQTPSSTDKAAMDHLVTALEKEPGVAHVSAPQASADGKVEMVEVVSTASPESKQTTELIDHLRADTIPKAEAGTGLQVFVGGTTATYADFAAVLGGKLPLFVGLIVALGFVLLVIAFRSLLVPLTAAVMNLLAAAASFGVVTAFFEWGWGSDALGMGRAGPVEAFVPVMMLAVLFGLSMDYQVFLVSRMHEEWMRSRDNAHAVRVGQVETSRVITIAATIMISVFCTFAFGSERIIGEFGIGLATAVALDAFVLRTVLVPAVMHLFGRANWWLPGWLDRLLPHLHVEPPEIEDAAPAPEATPVPVPAPAPGSDPVRPVAIPAPRPAARRVSAY